MPHYILSILSLILPEIELVMHMWTEFWSKTNIDVDFSDFVTDFTDFKIVHGERPIHSYDFK